MSATIYDRINDRLQTLGLTFEGASRKAGLARDYLRTLFRQKSSPTARSLNKLAAALETTPEWLMNGITPTSDVGGGVKGDHADIYSRIKDRLAALDLSPEGASKKAGLDRGYLRLLFERNSLPKLDTLEKLADALQTTTNWLQSGAGAPNALPQPRAIPNLLDTPASSPNHVMPLDVPVLGVVAGNHVHGAFQMEAAIIDYVRRAPGLFGAKNVYALYVQGDSMAPMHKAGDLLFIHPDRPPRIGDSVVVQFKESEGDYSEAMVGILEKRTPKTISLQKLNPPAIVDIDARKVEFVHRVLTMGELFGV
ncbi:helix-turn-helix domain-containing protein [Bartonella apis]|uniref:helix-turn-helix domain-containing protein n=1 Tax=Bartonella apis TaxID=1686310 RepID=UPI0024319035|nr:helix-turn-helix domain-containing protein [Bartonella apis]